MELAIDTSTRFASVGVAERGEIATELTWHSDRNHSVELMPAVDLALRRCGVAVADIDAVYVASGPGGFSALRVGMSAAKAMAAALAVPLAAVGTLDIEAQPYRGLGRPVCALIGAGRNRLCIGKFADGAQPECAAITREQLPDAADPGALFCGEAAADAADLLRRAFGGSAQIAAAAPPTRRAGTLAALGWDALQQGHAADPLTLEPMYLRSSQVDTANRAWRGNAAPDAPKTGAR